MPETRLLGQPSRPEIHIRAGTTTDALPEYRRLTHRDRDLTELLARHQVLTTDQIHRLFYDSLTTAQHRVVTHARRGVLARFRHLQRPGSQPWRYTLGVLGAIIHATTTGATPPPPSRSTAP